MRASHLRLSRVRTADGPILYQIDACTQMQVLGINCPNVDELDRGKRHLASDHNSFYATSRPLKIEDIEDPHSKVPRTNLHIT